MQNRLLLFPDDTEPTPRTNESPAPTTKPRTLRRVKREPIEIAPVPDEGPCCLRCENWRPPTDDEFGRCRHLGVITMKMRAELLYGRTGEIWSTEQMDAGRGTAPFNPGAPKGTVITIDEALELDLEYEPLRTRPGYLGCRGYVEKIRRQAA